MDTNPDSGRGSGKRGRPPVGRLEQVRLSEEEKSTALELGGGTLAKGVRLALQMARSTENRQVSDLNPQELRDILALVRILQKDHPGPGGPESLVDAVIRLKLLTEEAGKFKRGGRFAANHVPLSAEDMETAKSLGDGSAVDGVRTAMAAAKFLGVETVRKIGNGTGH